MFGIILGTLCLIALIRTISRERYYRLHGYPQYPHGHHGCGGCGYGHGSHRHASQAPAAQPTVTEGGAA